jgi:hypothetical protein
MKPFFEASYADKDKETLRQQLIEHLLQHPEEMTALGHEPTRENAERAANDATQHVSQCKVFKNDEYQVAIDPVAAPEGWPALMHLSIKRIDRDTIHDWRILQEIKNAIMGPECEAVELYPAESRVTDSANQYHLWCFLDPKARWPFGYKDRFVTDSTVGQSKQRPRSTP